MEAYSESFFSEVPLALRRSVVEDVELVITSHLLMLHLDCIRRIKLVGVKLFSTGSASG